MYFIQDGIKVPRIRIPKRLASLRVMDWMGILSETTPAGKLARKLALSAARRWSLAPDSHSGVVPSEPSWDFEATRRNAIRALQCLVNNYPIGVEPGLSIQELCGWAEIEIEFRRRCLKRRCSGCGGIPDHVECPVCGSEPGPNCCGGRHDDKGD